MTTWAAAGPVVDLLTALRAARTVRELFVVAADNAAEQLPFERALVLSVGPGGLTAEDCGALSDGPSDQLRRRVLAQPVEVLPRTVEAFILGRGASTSKTSTLADAFDLGEVCLAPVAAGGAPLALLVLERASRSVDVAEQIAALSFATTLGVALDHLLMRQRGEEVVAELRHLMVSATALLDEVQNGPRALPSTRGHGPLLSWDALVDWPTAHGAPLSPREVEIVERLVAGRSNREIAEELFLAPDTVKGHVARILRKLGAANRVEAVSRYLALCGGVPR